MRTREEHLKSWFDQQLRTARVARLPIYARGKTAQRYAFEREMASAQDCETPSDGYNVATGDYRAADGTTAAPAHRVAPDADQVGTMFGLLDTVQVGWVDIGTRLLLVDGRRTVARWDYLNVAPWQPAPVLPAVVPSYMVRRAVERPSRVARVIDGAAAALDLPTSAAVWQASIEPQRGHRWSLALEARGRTYCTTRGCRPNVPMSGPNGTGHFWPVPTGQRSRVRPGTPCRSLAATAHNADIWRGLRHLPARGRSAHQGPQNVKRCKLV
jgi:hypothetical protein